MRYFSTVVHPTTAKASSKEMSDQHYRRMQELKEQRQQEDDPKAGTSALKATMKKCHHEELNRCIRVWRYTHTNSGS